MYFKAIILFPLLSSTLVECLVEPGVFQVTLNNKNPLFSTVKTLFNESTVTIVLTKNKQCKDDVIKLQWMVRGTRCLGVYNNMNIHSLESEAFASNSLYDDETAVYVSDSATFNCNEPAVLSYVDNWEWILPAVKNKTADKATLKRNEKSPEADKPSAQHKRAVDPNDTSAGDVKPTTSKSKTTKPGPVIAQKGVHHVATVPMEGSYIVMVWIEQGQQTQFVDAKIEVATPLGYLSADQYPLLPFFMVMCIVYALFAVAWFVMSACNYRDLLRVQFWIGGVILLGMIEKAVFYSEYLNVNSTGISVAGAAKFAEIVSALKRSVARMLVIIVSLGFGIVKPRLGPMLHRVIGVGVLWFVLAVIEAMVRNDAALHDPDKNRSIMFAFIPLAVLDSIICWWIFMSLLQTMKTLRLRRNTVKLSLYRHFSNLIIFCVLASIVMVLWSVRLHQNDCIDDWSEVWMDVAFWHILFSIILLVIMILWRPNVNNQRYAYSPMIDGNDSDLEEQEESMLGSGAQEGMKMRGAKRSEVDKDANKTEEDLKWIEENIPQTVADAALPALLDSDEEVLTTKYEMSKME